MAYALESCRDLVPKPPLAIMPARCSNTRTSRAKRRPRNENKGPSGNVSYHSESTAARVQNRSSSLVMKGLTPEMARFQKQAPPRESVRASPNEFQAWSHRQNHLSFAPHVKVENALPSHLASCGVFHVGALNTEDGSMRCVPYRVPERSASVPQSSSKAAPRDE